MKFKNHIEPVQSLSKVDELFGEKGQLPLQKYLEYFESITTDDAESVDMCLTCAHGELLDTLLNGRFEFYDVTQISNPNARQCSVTRPFILAVVYGSLKTCDILIKHGVDIMAVEPTLLLNFVHCLVGMAVYEPDLEQTAVETYKHIINRLSADTRRQLLHMENAEGFHPLEFAVQQGCLLMMTAIFETRDVYLTRVDTVDLTVYEWYDITEYETPTSPRLMKAPLFILTCLDKRHITMATRMLREDTFLKDWFERSIRAKMPGCVAGGALRLIYVIMIYVFDSNSRWLMRINESESSNNMTSSFTPCDTSSSVAALPEYFLYVIAMYLFINSIVVIITPISTAYHFFTSASIAVLTDLKGTKDMIFKRGRTLDRTIEFTLGVEVIAEVLILALLRDRGSLLMVADVLRMTIVAQVCWNVLIYIQVIPVIGDVVIFTREMAYYLCVFLLIYVFFVSVFSQKFMLFFNINTKQGCIQDFGTFQMALYNLGLTMLNMLDFTVYNVQDKYLMYLHHFVYVTFVGILLLNLLIAVFSNTMIHVNEHKEVILGLSRLCVVYDVDISLFVLPFVHDLYNRYFTSRVKSNFVYEHGKVFLVCAKNSDLHDEAEQAARTRVQHLG